MRSIGTPAFRLTADCIWSSFRSSGKRHLILTGARGSGKTTLLGQLFPQGAPGLTTWAKPREAVYLRENLSGECVQVGAYDPALPGPDRQMVLLRDGFDALGAAALRRCIGRAEPWVTIDEIGYLEAQSNAFLAALDEVLAQKQVAAVCRQGTPCLQALRSRADVFTVDLDDPFGQTGCVIMASGQGRRFGGNKLLADFRGRPLVHCILDATEGLFARCVVVTRHAQVAQICEERGVAAVLHDLPHRSDTVRLGLQALPDVDRCMFTPADQPLLRRETVAALALAAANGPDCIWRTRCGEIPGSPVVFPHWTFQALQSLPEGMGGQVIIKKNPERLRTVTVRDADELRDVDSPEDLQILSER